VSRLARVFQVFQTAGLRLLPVPGTKWYKISDAQGRELFLKEKEIIEHFGDLEEEEVRERFLNFELQERS
jgi:hypothetical protein